MQYDGLVYKLTAVFYEGKGMLDMGQLNSDMTYSILMKKCTWNCLQDESVYLDWHHRRLLASMQVRNSFFRLAEKLVEENQPEKAFEVLKKSRKTISFSHWPVDYPAVEMAGLYFDSGKTEDGKVYTQAVLSNLKQWLDYYISMDEYHSNRVFDDFRYKLYLYQELLNSIGDNAPKSYMDRLKSDFVKYTESQNYTSVFTNGRLFASVCSDLPFCRRQSEP
ncbi:MAG TPA: hypothetical protein DIW50_09350 [Prolixibacteraceae bacterium]|nr:hypothetical protein [Prolixibacteraceae bacterium]